jgi:riboflavin transporter FmnP
MTFMRQSENIKRITRLGMLSAISVVLMLLVKFPLIPAAAFLEYTPSDIPLLIAALLYGPWYSLAAALAVCVIQGFTSSAQSGVIGIVMNFITTSVFCAAAGLVYRRGKGVPGAVLGLALGGISMAAMAVPCNLIFTPLYMGAGVAEVAEMLVPIIIPFNLLRAAISATATAAVFAPVALSAARAEK